MITAITDKEFIQLSQYIQNNYGIHLKEEKKALVTGRLNNVLLESHCNNFTEYFHLLQADKTGQAVTKLINKITTNHTFFMREADHFKYFGDKILPYLEKTLKDKDLRVWSAGCSSGEEPATLAMIINDYFRKEKSLWDTNILATDISDRILEKAKTGQYSNEQLVSLPINWRTNYFKKVNSENSVLIMNIRNEIIYRKFNLMDSIFPFRKKFHVIFCRNVMIYFDNKTKTELVNKFYEFTEPGGYLFIGHSESLNREQTRYKYVLPAVYRKE
jgi:chemotaxis protein methyltransferase CheR